MERISGACPYQSPTDMGVNMAGLLFSDDAVCREAGQQQIVRRYFQTAEEIKRTGVGEAALKKRSSFDEPGVHQSEPSPVARRGALLKEETTGAPPAPWCFPTGAWSRVRRAICRRGVGSAHECAQGGVSSTTSCTSSDDVLEPICHLKTAHLRSHNLRLHSDELLLALSISSVHNPLAEKLIDNADKLRGCDAYFSVIISGGRRRFLYRTLGINICCERSTSSTLLPQASHGPVLCRGRRPAGVPFGADFFSVAVGVLTGAIFACDRKLDIVGTIVLGLVTAYGGGIIRDLLLQGSRVYFMEYPEVIPICICLAVPVFYLGLFRHTARCCRTRQACLAGANKAFACGEGFGWWSILGALTSVGRRLRDISVGRRRACSSARTSTRWPDLCGAFVFAGHGFREGTAWRRQPACSPCGVSALPVGVLRLKTSDEADSRRSGGPWRANGQALLRRSCFAALPCIARRSLPPAPLRGGFPLPSKGLAYATAHSHHRGTLAIPTA